MSAFLAKVMVNITRKVRGHFVTLHVKRYLICRLSGGNC